jgi:arsenite methyltransferase
MFRLLKPSGRVAVSDILARKPLPEDIKASAALYIGCVGGASLVEEYQAWMKDAGFEGVYLPN